jgi:hypothetical protein
MSARATAPAQPQTRPAASSNDAALEAGGGLLLLVALGGAAYALSRRRRGEAEEEEESYADEPVNLDQAEPSPAGVDDSLVAEEQPALVAPPASAFSWGASTALPEQRLEEGSDDRRPGETWAERAYRGPSPSNPSLSLKKRLKRASFFDKREREAAEGKAPTVEPGAGLPDGATAKELELVDA